MRATLLCLGAIGLLAACDTFDSGPVDPAKLEPMSSQETALMVAADGAIRTGNPDAAEKDYQLAIKRSQGHVEAHIALARLYVKQGKAAQAIGVLNRARELQPNQPEVNYLLGKIYLQQNKPADAAEAFKQGLVGDPGNSDLLSGAAIAQDAQGQHKAAQTLYTKALDRAAVADRSLIFNNLALSYLLDNQPTQAVQLLTPEVTKPDAPAAMGYNLALAYSLQGKTAQAKKIIKGKTEYAELQESLGKLKAYIAAREKGGTATLPNLTPAIYTP